MAVPAGASASSPRITYYFGLTRPESKARAAFFAVQQPGSTTYRQFLTAGQVARRYGASEATKSGFVRRIKRLGLTARIDRSGVFARVTGTVRTFERVFHVRIQTLFNNDVLANLYIVAGNRALKLPPSLRPFVHDVVAAYSRSTKLIPPHPKKAQLAAAGPKNTGTWTDGCKAARATGAYSFAQVRHAYGIDAVGTGTGGSVAILNAGEGVTAQDIAEDRACFGLPRLATRTLLSDGQARPFGRGSFEPEEDLDLVRGAAPGLRSLTFTQVWLDPELWFLGAAQVFAASHLPDTFSISYGECERDIRGPHAGSGPRAGANLLDSLLVRLGLAGVGSFASAGDFGSTCNGQPFPGVAWPASSPFLTAVGGTRLVLNAANERSNEVVWNDLTWTSANAGGGAGGGGLSSLLTAAAVSARARVLRQPPGGPRRRRACVVVPRVAGRARRKLGHRRRDERVLAVARRRICGAERQGASCRSRAARPRQRAALHACAKHAEHRVRRRLGRQRLQPPRAGAFRKAGVRPREWARRSSVRAARGEPSEARPGLSQLSADGRSPETLGRERLSSGQTRSGETRSGRGSVRTLSAEVPTRASAAAQCRPTTVTVPSAEIQSLTRSSRTSPSASSGGGPSPLPVSALVPGSTVQRPESSAASARPCSSLGRSSGCGPAFCERILSRTASAASPRLLLGCRIGCRHAVGHLLAKVFGVRA